MKLNKLVLSILILIPFFFAYQAEDVKGATNFRDISTKHRAYDQISYLAQAGIISADDSSNRFYPNKYVSRAEVVTWIGKALNLSKSTATSKFRDVKSSHAAAGYIQSAVKAGIITGYTDGTFKPDQLVTRGEMALFISRAFDYGVESNSLEAVKVIMKIGIAQGYTNGNFGEYDKIIRADFAVFLARAIDYKQRVRASLPLTGEVKYTTANDLNVRTGPSTKYPSTNKLSKGTKVQVAYQVGGWTVVKSGSVVGFVSGAYLAANQPAPVPTPTPVPAPPPSNGGKSLSGLKLVIDPGHGGKDPGAVAEEINGLKESEVVLDTSLHLKKLLQSTPIQVFMTRESVTDGNTKPKQRAEYANSLNANLFISIHANAQGNVSKTGNGTETWYYEGSDDGKKLALFIQKRLVESLDTRDRGLKQSTELDVLEYTKMTAVLIELAFIDNLGDNAILSDPGSRQEAAKAIYNGILDFYKSEGYEVNKYYLK